MHELLVSGHVVLIDEADFEVVSQYRWFVARGGSRSNPGAVLYVRGYKPGHSAGRAIALHTLITGHATVDHVNHDGLDNRRENLREATQQQNMWNRRSFHGRSRFKGVVARGSRWVAQIKTAGVCTYLGVFDTEEAAAQAYDVAARERFGEFATLNGERHATPA